MARSQQTYNQLRQLAKNNDWSEEKQAQFNALLNSVASKQPTKATLTNTYQHVWGYFKKVATPEEKQRYLTLLAQLTPENDQLNPFLKELAEKYQVTYLLKSRLFQNGER
ncbi:YbgA family protein [Lentilactobacillus raoultii]|uniref:YbgA family protein n=1 Tax=Lentilactobacillus raoultii TaxID=1987503 RepID=A0ABW3PEV2_9LACO